VNIAAPTVVERLEEEEGEEGEGEEEEATAPEEGEGRRKLVKSGMYILSPLPQ
jgi:hypothetical protein